MKRGSQQFPPALERGRHPARLVLSADLYVGWPVTIQLAAHSLLTAYAITAYIKQPPEKTVTEIVRWKLP